MIAEFEMGRGLASLVDMRRSRRSRGGFVLVSVLWVLAILTVITLGFGRRALLERTAATYSLDYTKAMHMARGAVARGIVELRNKATHDFLSGHEGRTSYAQKWSHPVNLLESGEEGVELFSETGKEEFANDICAYSIQDEDGRLALSNAPDELLDELPGLSRSVIRKINYRRRGSLEDNEPAQPFQSIEELRFIEGVSDAEWFGDGRRPGLRELVTCFGDGLVNINTAPEAVLDCIPKVSGVAGAIINYRKGEDGELYTEDDRDFASLDEAGAILRVSGGAKESLAKYCKVNSQFFTITGTATRRNGKIRASCNATVIVAGASAYIVKWREGSLDS